MSKKRFFQIAEKAGCDVDYWREQGSVWLTVWAPHEQEFASSSCSCDSSFNQMTTPTGGAIDWDKACKALEQVIADGFQECA